MKATVFNKTILTKELVEKAVDRIETDEVQLNPSFKFDVLIQERRYPPKDIIRKTAEFNGYVLIKDTFSAGKQSNEALEKLGYKIVLKHKK